jgi:hypothetical protein
VNPSLRAGPYDTLPVQPATTVDQPMQSVPMTTDISPALTGLSQDIVVSQSDSLPFCVHARRPSPLVLHQPERARAPAASSPDGLWADECEGMSDKSAAGSKEW